MPEVLAARSEGMGNRGLKTRHYEEAEEDGHDGIVPLQGSGGRLLALVPVAQCREEKDGGDAGQAASDEENAVGVNEAVGGAQVFDGGARKSLQDFPQPGIGGTQERILRGGVSQIGEARHIRYERNARKAKAEIVTYHDEREETNAQARESESRKCGGRSCL